MYLRFLTAIDLSLSKTSSIEGSSISSLLDAEMETGLSHIKEETRIWSTMSSQTSKKHQVH